MLFVPSFMTSFTTSSTERLLKVYSANGLVKLNLCASQASPTIASPRVLTVQKKPPPKKTSRTQQSNRTVSRKRPQPLVPTTMKSGRFGTRTVTPKVGTPRVRIRSATGTRSAAHLSATEGSRVTPKITSTQVKLAVIPGHTVEQNTIVPMPSLSPSLPSKTKMNGVLSLRQKHPGIRSSPVCKPNRSSKLATPIRVAIFNPYHGKRDMMRLHPGGTNVMLCLSHDSEKGAPQPEAGKVSDDAQDAINDDNDRYIDATPPGLPPAPLSPSRNRKDLPKSPTSSTFTSENFCVQFIDTTKIRQGELGGYDVVVFPGGSSAYQAQVLGKSGRDAVRSFVASGGGFVGICAGAFLALSDYCPERSLKMVAASAALKQEPLPFVTRAKLNKAHAKKPPAPVPHRPTLSIVECRPGQTKPLSQESAQEKGMAGEKDGLPTEPSSKRTPAKIKSRNWEFGHGHCILSFSKLGRKLLWDEGRPWEAEEHEIGDGLIPVRYNNGPLIKVKDTPMIGSFSRPLTVLATFHTGVTLANRSTVHKNIMVDRCAIGYTKARVDHCPRSRCGSVVLCSAHPESTTLNVCGKMATVDKVVSNNRYKRLVQRLVRLAAGYER